MRRPTEEIAQTTKRRANSTMDRSLTTNTRVPKAVREAVPKTEEEAVMPGSGGARSLDNLGWRPVVVVRAESDLAMASASDVVPGLCPGCAQAVPQRRRPITGGEGKHTAHERLIPQLPYPDAGNGSAMHAKRGVGGIGMHRIHKRYWGQMAPALARTAKDR